MGSFPHLGFSVLGTMGAHVVSQTEAQINLLRVTFGAGGFDVKECDEFT